MEHESVAKLLHNISGRGLLVVGDFMVDRTIYGEAGRISPEAPAPVIQVQDTQQQLGGAGNVVRNVDSLGGMVWCAGVIGEDETATTLRELLCTVRGCRACCMVQEPGRKTTLKTRIVAAHAGQRTEHPYGHQQVVRFDEETPHPIAAETAAKILGFASDVIGQVDGVVVSDYAKGALPPGLLEPLIGLARKAGKPMFVDPKYKDWQRYRGASVLTPNAAEAEAALEMSFAGFENSATHEAELVQRKLHELCLDALLVTRGAEGVSLIDNQGFHHFPTSAREVFDVTGAGDTLIAAFALAAASGANWREAAQFGNLAAGVAVGKAGAAVVYPHEVEREASMRHFSADSKIRTREQMQVLAETLHRENKKIVFTNGCFDLLHVGHMYLLREAKNCGDVLVVGLNSDGSVKRLKGNGRPIVPGDDRAFAIAALECVDYLVVFDESDPMELIRAIRPDVLVKGDDYKESEVVGAEFLKSYGGVTRLVRLRSGVSTTALVEKIRTAQKEP
ncbi:MAG: D-glycero-beta-D-manno-heptose 1-phosphate adenylyltransferase [Acidobacteria bacterium]|nr:D-glycero-beta-D-manno-heptose 1-phosphate adenylyltransferase [Acidobacteriota bacterium]